MRKLAGLKSRGYEVAKGQYLLVEDDDEARRH
jgi:hypothetical protein